MPEKPPFLEDGSQYGVSRTGFRRMRKAEKRELMIQWFHQNFQNPDDSGTPWDDGEYVWIWGGPVEARDELYSKFGEIVPEDWVEEVVKEIEREGTTDWVPRHNQEDWEDIDWSERYDEPASLDQYLDEPTTRYGTPEELEARATARTALDRLERALERRRPVGIGHNQPPEELDTTEVHDVRQAAIELKLEFGRPTPGISTVKRWATQLRDALISCGKWGAKKLDKVVDAAAEETGKTIVRLVAGALVLSQCYPLLHNAFEAIIHWLDIAANSIL